MKTTTIASLYTSSVKVFKKANHVLIAEKTAIFKGDS